MTSVDIRLLLADVDGTPVTNDKALTAVAKLNKAGILFAITSERPPRGMSMLVKPLEISSTIAAFNGGLFAHPDMSVIQEHALPDDLTADVIDVLAKNGTDVWVYRGTDWFVLDPKGAACGPGVPDRAVRPDTDRQLRRGLGQRRQNRGRIR